MFEQLSCFRKIWVTGPQRSGTRITAKMIEYDTGYRYIDEKYLNLESMDLVREMDSHPDKMVLHCPALCRWIEEVSREDSLIVMVYRPVEEIIRSQERINWDCEQLELEKYGLTSGIISEVKYNYWETVQKSRIIHYLVVYYHGLNENPLWVDESRRSNFIWSQTEICDEYQT